MLTEWAASAQALCRGSENENAASETSPREGPDAGVNENAATTRAGLMNVFEEMTLLDAAGPPSFPSGKLVRRNRDDAPHPIAPPRPSMTTARSGVAVRALMSQIVGKVSVRHWPEVVATRTLNL